MVSVAKMNPIVLVEKTRDWFKEGNHWAKGVAYDSGWEQTPAKGCMVGGLAFFLTEENEPVGYGTGDAIDIVQHMDGEAVQALAQAIKEMYPRDNQQVLYPYDTIVNFNDSVETAIEDVIAVHERAIEILQEKQKENGIPVL